MMPIIGVVVFLVLYLAFILEMRKRRKPREEKGCPKCPECKNECPKYKPPLGTVILFKEAFNIADEMRRNNKQVRYNELHEMGKAFEFATEINPVTYDVEENVENLK